MEGIKAAGEGRWKGREMVRAFFANVGVRANYGLRAEAITWKV
jgi:hypothetical protein